jgi:hypothetical protein
MICGILLLSAAYPLIKAWRACRATTLRSALLWAFAAWGAWVIALMLTDLRPGNTASLFRYLGLCLTGCTGVAILGARRPGVAAWNFVVLAQLGVLLLPIAEGLGELHLDPLRLIFLAGTLAAGVLNYLPVRPAPGMVALALACGIELVLLQQGEHAAPSLVRAAAVSRYLLAGSPWLALAAVKAKRQPSSIFDGIWLGFRDRFGLVWGQRVREQFNRAAAHAGWPVVLRWRGLLLESGSDELNEPTRGEMVAALRALLKRFGPVEP